MKNSILLGLLCFGLTSQGQELRNRFGDVYFEASFYKDKYNSQVGTPYLTDSFTPAKINDIRETHLVRFDAYADRVEIMAKKSKFVILEDSEHYKISLLDGSGRVFETKSFIDEKGNSKASFFELIATKENYKIYLKERKKFTKAVKAQGYDDAKPAMFKKQKEKYYISDFIKQSEQLLTVPSKLKAFLAFLPDNSKLVKKYIKDNKLSIDKSESLVKIIEFYFSIP